MPPILKQLREIHAAMPQGTEVTLAIPNQYSREPKTEIRILIKGGYQSYYVEDWEWESGEIAEELIGHMRVIMAEKGLT